MFLLNLIKQLLINLGIVRKESRLPYTDADIARLIKKISAQMLAEGLYYILPEEGNIKPNVSHINNGCCGDFANRLLEHIDGEYIRREEFGIPHAFVLYNGCYYDSESPYGVSDWRDLPIWKDKFRCLKRY
jgi:hypothetical protein